MIKLKYLESVWSKPEVIERDDSLGEALYLMQSRDFSQLPVVHPNNKIIRKEHIKGYITWKSIVDKWTDEIPNKFESHKAKDYMLTDTVILKQDMHLLEALDKIGKNDFILVIDSHEILLGILTTYDITNAFSKVSEPVIRIGTIETKLRIMITDNFEKDEYQSAKNPSDDQREIKSVEDLTLGEIERFLQDKENWEKIKRYGFDRKRFLKDLRIVKDTRNDFFHFKVGIHEGEMEQVIREGFILDKDQIQLLRGISNYLEAKINSKS